MINNKDVDLMTLPEKLCKVLNFDINEDYKCELFKLIENDSVIIEMINKVHVEPSINDDEIVEDVINICVYLMEKLNDLSSNELITGEYGYMEYSITNLSNPHQFYIYERLLEKLFMEKTLTSIDYLHLCNLHLIRIIESSKRDFEPVELCYNYTYIGLVDKLCKHLLYVNEPNDAWSVYTTFMIHPFHVVEDQKKRRKDLKYERQMTYPNYYDQEEMILPIVDKLIKSEKYIGAKMLLKHLCELKKLEIAHHDMDILFILLNFVDELVTKIVWGDAIDEIEQRESHFNREEEESI